MDTHGDNPGSGDEPHRAKRRLVERPRPSAARRPNDDPRRCAIVVVLAILVSVQLLIVKNAASAPDTPLTPPCSRT